MTLIVNGLIHDAVHKDPYHADLLIEGGKIKGIGHDFSVDEEIYDAAGKGIYPGFVDAHTHIGVAGTGIGFEGSDYNEMGDCLTPQLRAIDSVNPFDASFEKARKAGVTSIATGSGSANVFGGTWAAFVGCLHDG